MATDEREVLRRVEGDYLFDYATFAGAMRTYITTSLEENFKKDKSDPHRRLFLLAVYREEYSAFEDLGAMLYALLTHRRDPTVPILEKLISYKPRDVKLSKIMKQFRVNSEKDLCLQLGLADLIPPNWKEQYPDLDIEETLKKAAHFVFTDCIRNQKDDGVRAFNKLKHGLLVVPKAQRYLRSLPDAPAAIFKTDNSQSDSDQNSFTLWTIPMTDEHLENRLRGIHFIQVNLRLIALLFVVSQYPEIFQKRGIDNPLDALRIPSLADVLQFLKELNQNNLVSRS